MRRGPTRIEQRAWQSPVRFVGVFLVLCWCGMFLGHRAIMLNQAWVREAQRHQDARFVDANICQHDWIKANLGEQYSEVCDRARYNARLWPIVSAVQTVVKQTHLCGDVECVALLRDVLEAVGVTVALVVGAALAAVWIWAWALRAGRRTRASWQYEETMPITWEPAKREKVA